MRRGFTLVELAIVMVIIGLIWSAILAGMDIVDMAKCRKQSKIEGTDSSLCFEKKRPTINEVIE